MPVAINGQLPPLPPPYVKIKYMNKYGVVISSDGKIHKKMVKYTKSINNQGLIRVSLGELLVNIFGVNHVCAKCTVAMDP